MGYNLLINEVYWGYNPLILTIYDHFQRDIQVGKGETIILSFFGPRVHRFCNRVSGDGHVKHGPGHHHGCLCRGAIDKGTKIPSTKTMLNTSQPQSTVWVEKNLLPSNFPNHQFGYL